MLPRTDAGGPPRVLVVEDDPTNLLLLRAVLARAPDPAIRAAFVVEARSLGAAYGALAGADYDLVLLDIRLPDGDGLDVARLLRERSAEERPKVLILSASVLPAEREAALAAGGDQFLAKPYQPAALLAACTELLSATPTRPID